MDCLIRLASLEMTRIHHCLLLLYFIRFQVVLSQSSDSITPPHDARLFPANQQLKDSVQRLSKPLVRDDRVYSCSGRNLLAFESNGTIAWTLYLNYTCNLGIAPVHGGSLKIYLVAQNRVLLVNPLNMGTSESSIEILFGPEAGEEENEIVGLAVSTLSSTVIINVKNRGLLAYRLSGQLRWSAGPILYRSGYRQGCLKNKTDCYFASSPVIDHCEATVYMSNNEGELYAIAIRSPNFKWVQDLSSVDKSFTITPGNNGRLYVTFPSKAIVLAIDAYNGTVLWQKNVGPLSSADFAPTVDSNGWISFGSLDGFLYSFSPFGMLKRFQKSDKQDYVIQISPSLDCSGYGIYLSQTEMQDKISRVIGEYNYISAMKPRRVVFTLLLVPSGFVYWSESYPASSQLTSLISGSDLGHFLVDERILLAFISASKMGSPLQCRSTRQKLSSSCSLAEPKHSDIYTGNERAIVVFLVLELVVLILLAVGVRFCCILWRKKKLKGQQGLVRFLEKRRSLHLQKKAFDRTISKLEKKGADTEELEAGENNNKRLEKLSSLVRAKEGIERKLLTTYSLGSDKNNSGGGSNSNWWKPPPPQKTLLPFYRRSYSFSRGGRKEIKKVSIFNTLSDTTSSEGCERHSHDDEENNNTVEELLTTSDNEDDIGYHRDYDAIDEQDNNYNNRKTSSSSTSSSGFGTPLASDKDKDNEEEEEEKEVGQMLSGSGSIRRRTSCPTTNKSGKGGIVPPIIS